MAGNATAFWILSIGILADSRFCYSRAIGLACRGYEIWYFGDFFHCVALRFMAICKCPVDRTVVSRYGCINWLFMSKT